MRAVLPGKPQARLHAVSTGYWNERQVIAYISGNAFVILGSHDTILQTIYNRSNEPLEAIAVDEATGKIATCAGREVRVYSPSDPDVGNVKWSLRGTITLNDEKYSITSLSWGGNGELLSGGDSLTLFSTEEKPTITWSKTVANRLKYASLSYDAGYIASTGFHDRLVKIWRRWAYGADDVRFDFTYLPHTGAVSSLRWRRPYHLDQTIENVLYTVCVDQTLRVWAISDLHGLQNYQLRVKIDLRESIQVRSLGANSNSPSRYVFIIDGRDFSKATEHAVQATSSNNPGNSHALQHLIEVANRSPEICVVLDDSGHMSAWGLENLELKVGKGANVFNIAHVSGLRFDLRSDHSGYVQFHTFCNQSGSDLGILVHHFDGTIEHFESNLAHLFDLAERSDRVVFKALWTGHSGPIKKIVRNISGRAIVSRTGDDECIVWKHAENKPNSALLRQSTVAISEHIHRICVLRDGDFVVFLHHTSITFWDCRTSPSRLLGTQDYSISGKPLCVLVLPETEHQPSIAHIATISSNMKGIVWELHVPGTTSQPNGLHKPLSEHIREFCTFDLGEAEDLAYVLPVDPAGSLPVISGFLDTFARDVAISYTNSGLLRSWTAKIDGEKRKADWLLTCSVHTGITNPALASGSSIRKAALVNANRSELTIWDVRGEQLEFSQAFEENDVIQDLDWTSTPDDQSILAVGFPHRVLLLSQMRYDYLDKGPAWAAIHEINVLDLTPHSIGDSTWLGGGNLVVGAGNQLYAFDKKIKDFSLLSNIRSSQRNEGEWDLFEVVTRLNGPLPVFHPQFLSQCILAGKMTLVQQILLRLYHVVKYKVPGEEVDSLLGLDLTDFYVHDEVSTVPSVKKESTTAFDDLEDDEELDTLTETVATNMNEKLTKLAIPQLSGQSQIALADIVECVAVVEKQRRSMDENAARFMVFFRQHALRRSHARELHMSWREINWAFHSNSQDILTDIVSRQFHGRMLWENARESGLFMWLTDSAALRNQFEIIARNEYNKSEPKNPINCSLYYLALKKKAVLQGLWRMATWNREQSATSRLLSNNFQDPKWKTVALKNAYALLGKHRYEYAAAFFLLADSLRDAVNICFNQLKDLQLAITIIRVYEGDSGPVLKEVLEERILPLAAEEGNRWLASWAFWMLRRRDMAVRALISPVYTLLETPMTPDLQSKLYLTDDPALIVLYAQLRQKTLQTLRGASKVTPKVEWEFVLHSARLYDRMGCDLLALDLVRNWEFLLPTAKVTSSLNGEPDPRNLLRRRSSLVVADMPTPISPRREDGLRKPPPSVFEEPDSSSLLDNFGF